MRRRLSPRHAAQSALAARGAGLLKPSSIRSLRSSRDRHPNPTASPTGPSHGLPQSVARIPPIWRGRRRSPALPDRPQPGGIAAALQATRAGARRKRRAWAATKKAACRRTLGGTGRPLPDLPAAGIAAFPFGLDDALARTARPGLEAAARGLACGVSGRRALQALPPARARHGRCRRQAALRRPALIARGAPHRSALGRSARCARCPHGLWSRQPQGGGVRRGGAKGGRRVVRGHHGAAQGVACRGLRARSVAAGRWRCSALLPGSRPSTD